MSRLKQIDSALVASVGAISESKRLAVKRFAIQTVLAVIPKTPEISQAIQCVAELSLPNLVLSKTILEVADLFDEKSFQGKEDDSFDWFCFYIQARALRALSHALEENTVESACDCVYESLHSSTPEKMFIQEINDLIRP